MPNRSINKRPRDVNRLARFVMDIATGNPITEDISPISGREKNPADVALGRLGGLKGGKARAATRRANKSKE